MASQEHLQMLHYGDSTSTSSEDDDEETSSENGEAPVSKSRPIEVQDDEVSDAKSPSGPAKKRIKLSLGKVRQVRPLPINGKKKENDDQPAKSSTFAHKDKKTLLKKPGSSNSSSSRKSRDDLEDGVIKAMVMDDDDDLPRKKPSSTDSSSSRKARDSLDDGVIRAMVVDSDEAGEDDAIAAVVEEPTPAKEPVPKKRPGQPVRAVRFPPMSSPGLLIPAVSGIFRETVDENGFTTPASVFDHAMSLAGYTVETRTKHPHRGSSVKKVVGDMFDSNVKFAHQFPKLVPQKLLDATEAESDSHMNGKSQKSLPERLMHAFRVSPQSPAEGGDVNGAHEMNGGRPKLRRKLAKFSDMAPLSLTMPYPENYIKKRLEYIEKIKEREKAIVDYQEKEEALEIEHEKKMLQSDADDEGPPKPDIVIPPIPEPPSPPSLKDMAGIDTEKFEDEHPLYLPKGQQQLVSHLDKNCFHVTDGRYFGLLTNSVADPHFIGPNAPGITGINLSGGAGLATANTGGGGAAAAGGLLAATVPSAATTNSIPAANKNNSSAGSKQSTKKATGSSSNGTSGESGKKIKKKGNGPKTTASSSQLRKLVEEGGEAAEKIKTCIIRAAVHASRTGKHGQSFRAPNGEVYPDISKAFAAHAGLKPCNRCKNNKQGAYHCRLRRKHKELDYDGSNSPAVLEPLFAVPMEELILKP